MARKYTEEEDSLIELFINDGCTHKEIGILLNRTTGAIKGRCLRLHLQSKNSKRKTHEQYVKDLAEKNPTFIVLEQYLGDKIPILHMCTICNTQYNCRPNDKLNGYTCKYCHKSELRTHSQYLLELSKVHPTLEVLGNYVGSHVNIDHKCTVCKTISSVSPYSKLDGHGCGICNISNGIDPNEPGIVYLVYFYNIDLYKYGITGRTTKIRNKVHKLKYHIIFERHFKLGIKAMQLEDIWSKNVQHLKINTGLLKNGNTETFRY